MKKLIIHRKTILLNYTTFMKYTRKKSLPFTPHTSLSTEIYCVYTHDFVYCIAYRRTRFPYCRKRREKTIKMAGYWDQIGTRLLVHIIQNKIGKNFLDIHMQSMYKMSKISWTYYMPVVQEVLPIIIP